MVERELVEKFFLEYYKEYKSTLNELDSYDISGSQLIIRHHTQHGKTLVTEFSIWEVVATLLS